MTANIDLSELFMRDIPKQYLTLDPDRIRRIHDFYDFAIFLPVRYFTYVKAYQVLEKRKQAYKRMRGYRGWHFLCYWWFVSWYAISLGVTVHVRKPCNIEFHVPFGFVRVGFPDVFEREAQYEEWLNRYIVKRYEAQEAER